MVSYSFRDFTNIVKRSGYKFNRCSGSHHIYINDEGRHISVPRNLRIVLAQRLIKEYNLNVCKK